MKHATQLIVERLSKAQKEKQRASAMANLELPLWGEAKRGLPNVLARSALFNARRNGDEGNQDKEKDKEKVRTPASSDSTEATSTREYLRNVPIASLSNYKITYRGEELRQDDASVFMQLLHLARTFPMGAKVPFTAYSMIKSLGWGVSGLTYKRLRECIERLSANTVKIQMTDGSAGYGKSLVRSFAWKDDASGETLSNWVVEFEPEILALFAGSTYTLIEWQERRQIGSRATLALWLHSFLATHEEPMALSVGKYYELSESRCKLLYHFRGQLKQALERLMKIGFVESFEITKNDLVNIRLRPRHARLQQAATT